MQVYGFSYNIYNVKMAIFCCLKGLSSVFPKGKYKGGECPHKGMPLFGSTRVSALKVKPMSAHKKSPFSWLKKGIFRNYVLGN